MTTALVAAGISALVALLTTVLAAPLRVWVEQNLLSHKLRAEYEYEQRRELRKLIGRYLGRLVEAAEQLHYRFLNIYAHDPEGWLTSPEGFYFKTTCYRLLHLVGLARAFEREAFYVDSRIAEAKELDFVRFIKAFFWALSDPALFKGLEYEEFRSTDHFFADQLRLIGEAFCPREGECHSLNTFLEGIDRPNSPFADVKEFLTGLHRSEQRLRWGRLVVLHLFLIGFLNSVGYGVHKSSENDIDHVVRQLRHREIGENLVEWLPRLELAEQEAMNPLIAIIKQRV